MPWLPLAILTAVAVGIRDASVKLFRELGPFEVAALEMFWSLPFLAAGLLLVPIPPLDTTFWLAFLVSIPLNLAAYLIYVYAIKISPLSLTVPFLAFTPLFMMVTGRLILHEQITVWGGLGILLIVAGSYLLNLSHAKAGLLRPWQALLREKGSWLMLIVAFLFAIAAAVGKKAILHSSPLFFGYSFFFVLSLTVLVTFACLGTVDWPLVKKHSGKGLWLALLLMAHISFHCLAITLATAAYMIAVKRSSILISVMLGWLLLREEEMLSRGIGTVTMFCGMLLISLLG